MSAQKALTKDFEDMVKHYLVNCSTVRNELQTRNMSPELEIRFGTNPKKSKPITSVDYQNVVKTLGMNGWSSIKLEGIQMLRIIPNRVIKDGENIRENIGAVKNMNEDESEKSGSKESYYSPQTPDGPPPNFEIHTPDGPPPNFEIHTPDGPPPGFDEDSPNRYDGGGRVKMKSSNIRAEIYGVDLIQEYCQHNDLEKMKKKYNQVNNLMFTRKTLVTNEKTKTKMKPIDFADFNFRVSYMNEEEFRSTSTYQPILSTYANWQTSLKKFRSINRVRFEHPDLPVFVDISIVKSNRKHVHKRRDGIVNKFPVPTETVQESNVFNESAAYEIELELDNKKAKHFNTPEKFAEYMQKIRSCIRTILSALQGTPYPISYDEQEKVMHSYMCRLYGDSWMETRKPYPFFVGPNSVPLQLDNVVENTEGLSSIVNIRHDYTVTEKADGERALLYIAKDGRVYMITYSLKVVFTGSKTKEKRCFDSILDGEFIMFGKNKKRLFLYAAFDIYYFGGMEKEAHVRQLPFATNDDTALEDKYRLPLLQKFHEMLKLEPVTQNSKCEFSMRVKHFETCNEDKQSIFEASFRIWEKHEHFDYEIDGMIFTPMKPGVGGTRIGDANEINGKKFTWRQSFKWKPPKYNTIDFLATTEKDKDGKDLVRNIVHDQDNRMNAITQYKTLNLYCGLDKKKHKFMNPFDDVLYDNIPKQPSGHDDETKYEVKKFVPTVPYYPESYLCNVPLVKVDSDSMRMKTEEGDYFEDNVIVEFRYAKDDANKKGPWKWIPLRVRQDKTQQLREGGRPMNEYETANNNWKSIHFPVTEEMITGVDPVSNGDVTDTIYYSLIEKDSLQTNSLRDFHNLYVKLKLIEGIANYLRNSMNVASPNLIDYAVGKAGDLSKWTRSKVGFVLGIDNHGDNITNAEDGACVRYLTARKKDKKSSLRALFVEGDSSKNIRTEGKAFQSSLEKDLVQSVFGHGKNMDHKKYAFKHGIAKEGFHISSCQFALHYFFENKKTLHTFLQNLAECTKDKGFFIGTCFDGKKVFQKLHKRANGTSINEDESVRIDRNGKKVFEIKKKYSSSIQEFPDGEDSIGMPIYVYQESIDKMFIEYLVNFDYFVRLMEDYGFVLWDESRKIGLATSAGSAPTGGFDILFKQMQRDTQENPDLFVREAPKLQSFEKQISFLNRYFIFQKVRDLSQSTLKNMQSIITEQEDLEEIIENEEEEKKQDEKEGTKKVKKIRKVKTDRIVLNDNNTSPIIEELAFKDPELQMFYNNLPQKTKRKFAMFPERDALDFVKYLWKKKTQK